jgi:parvulin-like peptidyl-prolyl isomerase
MGKELNFSLEQKKPGRSAVSVMTLFLLGVVAVFSGVTLYTVRSGSRPVIVPVPRGLDEAGTRELASKLAQRNLYERAAAVWQDYLAQATLTAPERATALFHVATLLEKAGQPDAAIEYYYRSEMTADLDELRSQINAHVKQCFESLGNFSALRYELIDRTSMDGSTAAGTETVAEIGAEKITQAELDATIERSIENQLTPMAAFLAPEQLNEQKERLLEQYRDPQARQDFLRNWLAQEILYRQALAEGLGEDPEVRQLVDDVTRGLLSQQMMNAQLASRINITETDLQTFYTANKDRYTEPARATISHIRVGDRQQADALLGRLTGGQDFASLAKEFSTDEATKSAGGRIESDIIKGQSVPGIGEASEINAAIFAAVGPVVLAEPFETDAGWEIIKVERIQPERLPAFDEVRQQVMADLSQRKSQEVQQQYLEEMMNTHNVVIHTSAFVSAGSNTEGEAPQAQ